MTDTAAIKEVKNFLTNATATISTASQPKYGWAEKFSESADDITFQLVSTRHAKAIGNESKALYRDFNVEIWSDKQAKAVEIMQAIRAAAQRSKFRIDLESDIYDQACKKKWHKSFVITVFDGGVS